jgi:hypothetical protein
MPRLGSFRAIVVDLGARQAHSTNSVDSLEEIIPPFDVACRVGARQRRSRKVSLIPLNETEQASGAYSIEANQLWCASSV